MPVLPLPLLAALVLLYLLVRALVRRELSSPVRAVLALCALQATIVTAHQYYGVTFLAPVQPVTASAIPPLCYLGFRTSAMGPVQWPQDARHAWAPAFALFCVLFAPAPLDAVVPAIFILYGAAILMRLRAGGDALIRTRLESGDVPVTIWRLMAVCLFASALSDILISIDFVVGPGNLRAWIVGAFTSATLVGLGILTMSRAGDAIDEPEPPRAPASPPAADGRDAQADAALVTRLKALLDDQALYRNPELTLGQLARRLVVPAKTLSAAINRVEKKNVSQFVNDYRVREACRLLTETGATVTTAMLESGFQTKSNFNRAFRHATGTSPTQWLAARKQAWNGIAHR
ncbi:MAG: helix-turn-helix domain-containing protein [Inquilinaceae bacterium]